MTALPPQPHGSLMWPRRRHRLRAPQSDCGSMARRGEHRFSSSHGQIPRTVEGQVQACQYMSVSAANTGHASRASPVTSGHAHLYPETRCVCETEAGAAPLQQRPIKKAGHLLIDIKPPHIKLWFLMQGEIFSSGNIQGTRSMKRFKWPLLH